MDITKLPENIKDHVENRLDEIINSLQKNSLSLPEDCSIITKNNQIMHQLRQVIISSEFVSRTFIRNPSLLIDLIKSGDLERSYCDGGYKLKIEQQIKSIKDLSSVKNSSTVSVSDNSAVEDIFLKEQLGKIREREMVRIAWQDITGKVSLEQTLKDLSDLAEACVDKAITFIYDKLCSIYGTPLDKNGNVQQLIVLGMGKLGAGELNFSSDIDLIFVYPDDAPFEGKFNTTGEFFTKMCKNFLKVFDSSMVSSNGSSSTMLFRVDTRLRPFGANGPIAMSFYTMEDYYQTQGRDWERYALIKARPIAGDIAAGYTLLKTLNPFIYRRYFDYGSFDSLRDMKKRISLQVRDKRFKNNIKLGAGGIREIEFFGQVFQLIRGGVEPEFQERKILKVLDLLVERNCIAPNVGEELTDAYYFLRKVENRLQQHNDRQTHDLPDRKDEQLRLAISMGFQEVSDEQTIEAFNKVLYYHIEKVHAHFRNLFETESMDRAEDEDDVIKYIWQNINDPQFDSSGYKIAGFEDSARFSDILRTLSDHPNTKKLTTTGRRRLDRLIYLLVHRIGQEKESFCPTNGGYDGGECISSNPETVLKRLVDLVITIERRTCYLSLLIEKSQAIDSLVSLAARSPWVISFLALHPALLDELLAPSTLYTPPDRAEMEKDIARRLAYIPVDDFEFKLEEICIFKQVMTLRVAAADLSGNYPLMKVSDRLTEIAETVMNKVIEIAWHHTVQKYGLPSGVSISSIRSAPSSISVEQPSVSTPFATSYSAPSSSQFLSPGFAAIAYGKLGGIELGYKSDLDMVFIYSGNDGYTEGGPRSIENIRFYTFLGQRIINALTLTTQAGKLYEADMRLRPNGQSGMIVSHIDAFHDYIKNEAWTWEHQAIIRARPIGGDPALQKRFNEIREKVLCIERDPAVLKKEVRDMREKMRREHAVCPPNLFDLKHGRGAIVDIEFLVQYLVLENACEHPALTRWTDNVRLLESLANENILTHKEVKLLKSGYLKLRQMVHHLNLQEREKIISLKLFKDESDAIAAIFKRVLY